MTVEHDWIVLLAGPNRLIPLAEANVVLNQIDIVCEIVGASLLVILPSKYDIMTTSKDQVNPSPKPDSWKPNEIFATGVVIATYLVLVTVLFYWVIDDTTSFQTHFHVSTLKSIEDISSGIYLQANINS